MRLILPVALLLALLPGAASALTVQEVVALSKAGISDEVLLTLIDRDKTIFAIDADQLIVLTRDRVSEKLVLAMLRSGRQEPPPAPAAPPTVTYAAPTDPGVLMFGHGPTRPNTYHEFDRLGLSAPEVSYAVPYFAAPFGVPAPRSYVTCEASASAARSDRTTGIAAASATFVNNALPSVLAAAGGGEIACQPVQTPPPQAPALSEQKRVEGPPPSRAGRRPRR